MSTDNRFKLLIKRTWLAYLLAILWIFIFYTLQSGTGVLCNGIELGQEIEMSSLSNNVEKICSSLYRITDVNNSVTSVYAYTIWDSKVDKITGASNNFTVVRNRPWYIELLNFEDYTVEQKKYMDSIIGKTDTMILTYSLKGDSYKLFGYIILIIYIIGSWFLIHKVQSNNKKEVFMYNVSYSVIFLIVAFSAYTVTTYI